MLYPLGWLLPDAQIAPQATPPEPSRPTLDQPIAKAEPQRPSAEVNQPMAQALTPALAFSNGERLAHINGEVFDNLRDAVYSHSENFGTPYLLQLGSQGEAVKGVQTRLRALAYYSGDLDGLFGPLTQQAVKSFQGAENLKVDGIVGPVTWQRLQVRPQVKPSTGVVVSKAIGVDAAPQFTPAQLPSIDFHPLEVVPNASNSKVVWIAVLTLTAVGGALYFKPDKVTPAKNWQVTKLKKPDIIHQPQPVYPTKVKPKLQQEIHGPLPSQNASFNTPTQLPEAEENLVLNANQLAEELHRISQTFPWATDPTTNYLTDFVYDLQAPDSRQQLETRIHSASQTDHLAKSAERAGLAALLRRLGTFPEANRRTGHPYTYSLLDDLGGCFRMCGHELWVTSIAQHWLSDETPYTVTVRRMDYAGKVVDKHFTVTLKSLQLQMAS
jgi:peptidoglycan hydrolase-like protein with peptidoglycan-binding domain